MASSVTDKLSFHTEQRSLADNPHPDIFLVLQFFGINEPRPLDLGLVARMKFCISRLEMIQ